MSEPITKPVRLVDDAPKHFDAEFVADLVKKYTAVERDRDIWVARFDEQSVVVRELRKRLGMTGKTGEDHLGVLADIAERVTKLEQSHVGPRFVSREEEHQSRRLHTIALMASNIWPHIQIDEGGTYTLKDASTDAARLFDIVDCAEEERAERLDQMAADELGEPS